MKNKDHDEFVEFINSIAQDKTQMGYELGVELWARKYVQAKRNDLFLTPEKFYSLHMGNVRF
jgi:hypothetical protein